ncbi:hypothetical protein [Paraburkholderia sp.]
MENRSIPIVANSNLADFKGKRVAVVFLMDLLILMPHPEARRSH